MPGARRAPPPPPSGTGDSPPPLPSRNGPGPKTVATDSAPPPLPSRPGATVETADDMYEDMNGGFPKIIDARPNKKITSQAILPPGHNSNSNSMQQPNLVMEETYEMPVANTQVAHHGFPSRQEQRDEKPDADDDVSDEWSDFDDVDDGEEPTGDDTYEMPECQEQVQDEVYEQADEVETFNKPVPPPPSKKPAGVSATAMSFHPATLQIGKLKLNNISSQESSSSSQKNAATNNVKPLPPPKPANSQAMSGSSIVQALTQKLNERAKGLKSGFEKTEAKEIPSDDNSSAGSSSSQSGAQRHIAAKEVKAKFEESNAPKNVPLPPKKPARQVTVEEADESDLIYDEAVSESLSLYDWYHGQVDRKEAVARVRTVGQNGAFLIRESSHSSSGHRYTLVVMCNGKVHNLVIRQRSDNNLAIGQSENPDEVYFSSLKDLVEHHRENNVRLLKEEELVMLSSSPKPKRS